jgi:hypothetical protein
VVRTELFSEKRASGQIVSFQNTPVSVLKAEQVKKIKTRQCRKKAE